VCAFGKQRLVEDLAANDFELLRADIADGCGTTCVGNDVQRTKTVFKYALRCRTYRRTDEICSSVSRPSKATFRKAKNDNAPKLFEAAEIRKLLNAANPQLKAMILLGINCGFDLDAGWVTSPRPKTAVGHRCDCRHQNHRWRTPDQK